MENKKTEHAVRIQTSILNAAEKKVLVWLAERQPKWVTSDMLTYFGIFGAIVVAVGYVLSIYNINWLWLSTFGFFLNWYGDSLDGTLARVRKTQRPLYGFFIDHNVDGITIAIMCIGAGLSQLLNLYVAMLVLVAYLLLSIYVYISAHLKGEFKLTYFKMGPTEFRLIVMIINTLFIYVTPLREYSKTVTMLGIETTFGIFDYIAIVIFILLMIMHISSLIKDGKEYAKLDPLKKPEN